MPFEESGQSPPHSYFVDLAKKSPRIPANKLTPFERERGHDQFGESFFMLFLERQRLERDPNADRRTFTHLQSMEEKYGSKWSEFVKRNSPLIHKIDEALDGLKPYDELMQHDRDLFIEESETGDDSKSKAFGALDIEGVGIYVWRPLNKLLKKVDDQMKKEGVDFFA